MNRKLRLLLFFAPLLGVLLSTPALDSGLVSEDEWHGATARSMPWTTPLFGAPTERSEVIRSNYAAKDAGTLPWIAVDDLRFAFLRPLSSALVHLDWALWPASSALMHLHSLLWYALMLATAALLYRRWLGSLAAAALAALFFALDPGHAIAASWLASRSVVVGVAFGLAALWAHDRARRDGWRPGVVLTPALLGLAFLAGEIALGAIGYFGAHALLLDRAHWKRRIWGALPWLIPLGIWAGAYTLLGYGTYGSGVYIDPVSEPMAFMRELPMRWSAYAFSSLTRYPSDYFAWAMRGTTGAVILAAVAILFTVVLVALVRRSPAARFWLLGMSLSAVAVCTTEPSGRVAAFPLFGGVALASLLVTEARWFLAAPLVIVHAVLPLVLKPLSAASLAPYGAQLTELASDVYRGTRPGQQVVIVAAPSYYTGTVVVSLGALGPNRYHLPSRVLYAGFVPVKLTRTDARTLEVRAPQGFIEGPLSAVYRGSAHRMRVGQGLQLTGAQIVVTGVSADGMPDTIEFRGAWPLDGPRYHFVAWNGRRYAALPLPSPGQSWTSGPW